MVSHSDRVLGFSAVVATLTLGGPAWAAPASGSAEASASVGSGTPKTASSYRAGVQGERRAADAAEKAEEKKKKWFRRWVPERNELDAGMYFGAFFVGKNHGLFDPGQGPQPEINRNAFAMGFRASYFPLAFLGAGFEGGFMPTRSPELDVDATLFTFRGHVIGQLPYRLTPTMVMGAGLLGINSSTDRLESQDPAFHYGPGAKFHINKWIAVRIDGRHLVTGGGNDGNRVHNGEVTAGVEATIRLGRIISRRRKRYDADDDGIRDRDDKCPKQAGDWEFDGCPGGEDRDKDGTPDDSDRCPDRWGDLPNGCPTPDADSDGILDSKDQCPDEGEVYNGVQDDDGCPDEAAPAPELEKLSGVIEGIRFASGKAKIRQESNGKLNEVVKTLEKFPDIRLEIIGHTDSTGSRDKNVDLSKARADAVKAYLVGKGIADDRLSTRGAGPDEPISDNGTKVGRAKNRRIEFKVQ